MNLNEQEQRQLSRASDAMLRPFEHIDFSSYLKECAAQVRPLLGAYAAVCGSRYGDGQVEIVTDDYSAADVEEFARWKLNDGGTQRLLELGVEVFSMRTIVGLDWDGLEADSMMNEWYWPRGMHDAVGYALLWPEDDAFATVEFHHRLFGTQRMGHEGEAILQLLLPSQRAGAKLLWSLGRHRLRLARDLESLGVCLCVCAHDGRIMHAAASLGRLLEADAERESVYERVRAVARSVAQSAWRRNGAAPSVPPEAHQLVTTASATYRLSGAIATHEMQFGASDILVTVTRLTPVPLSVEALMAQFGLTPREADVALHVARGERNGPIATALGLSPHTVRRHTERLLAKLGVTSRSQAAARLRG